MQNFPKTNISYPLICTCTCAYQGVKNNSFSENFAYVLNESSQIRKKHALKNISESQYKIMRAIRRLKIITLFPNKPTKLVANEVSVALGFKLS